ncbi:hypothetical protein E2C01_080584 [Portunus trituberculatus]|uniref:Uncharacterized protein n=1 Tax=Portunus trituberculatus TaxID=210409 RepID=A0A5B7IUG0_PORTR|nr:hypothetical protein [Portunus trituberculatus]
MWVLLGSLWDDPTLFAVSISFLRFLSPGVILTAWCVS